MKNVNKPSTSIKNWSVDDRPREKMIRIGSSGLSNAELIAILINTGNVNQSALEIAMELMKGCNNSLNELGKLTVNDLQKTNGIGLAKSVSIAAALELGRRRNSSEFLEKPVVRSSTDVANFLNQSFRDLQYEIFAVVLLNRANKIIHYEVISKGGITGTVADPRLILKLAISHGATSIILSHNHPSGNLKPSKADEEITDRIKKSAALMDIKLLDHIIVSEEGYLSFMDEGIL
jgi:DNA repair protein RadC